MQNDNARWPCSFAGFAFKLLCGQYAVAVQLRSRTDLARESGGTARGGARPDPFGTPLFAKVGGMCASSWTSSTLGRASTAAAAVARRLVAVALA